MSNNKVVQTELFIKYLPTDLSRYTYKFIYRDVKVSFWRNKYNMHDLLNNLYDYCGGYDYFPDTIIEIFTQYFPNDIHKIVDEWFLFKKCDLNNSFINDWVYFSCYTDNEINYPLLTYHHTGDQSIFNILVVKYKKPVFYHKNIKHDENKNKNVVLNIINNATDTSEYFIYL